MPDEQTVDKSDYALVPPEGHPKVGQKVFWVLSQVIADKVRLGLHDRWFRNYQLRKGKHWKTAAPTGVPLVSANLIFTHVQRTVNTLTDNNPTFNVIALAGDVDDERKESMLDLQRTTEYWWNEQEQQDVLETSVLNGEQYGPAIEKVVFNPDLEYALGEVETVPVDPFRFGWYPVRLEAARDLQKCEAVLHFYPMSVRQLRGKYPAKAARIKPDKEMLKELMDSDRREIGGQEQKGGFSLVEIGNTVKNLINFFSGGGGDDEEEETLAVEMWLRDKTRVVDPKGGDAPKYPGEIRYILACSGGVTLEDKPNPNINPNLSPDMARQTYLYDKFPFAIANSVKDTSSAWGMTDIEQMEWLLMEINKCLSQLVLEKDRSARKKMVIPKSAGVNPQEMVNYPTIIQPASGPESQYIRWIETPPASVDYAQTIEMFKSLFMLVGGTFDLDQAQVGGREVIAYKAIAALLERAATMSRGKIRAYGRLIRERGRMYLSHVMNFYTEERWITYRDAQGNDAVKQINGSKLIMPAKLSVVSGSTMPISQVQRREEATELYKEQAIDQPELLERLNWPNRAEVVKRMQAGRLGMALQNLEKAGTPDEFLQFLKTVAEADPKDLQKSIEKGEFPTFMQFLEKILAQAEGMQPKQDPAQAAEYGKINAEIQKALAQAEKLTAEKELTVEKIMTEKIQQQVAMAGVEFDKQKLAMDRAKIVSDIETEAEGRYERGVDAAIRMEGSVQKNRPGYNERGLKSNNKEA